MVKRQQKQAGQLSGIQKKLGNPRFVDNADPELVAADRARQAELELELAMLEENLTGF